LPRSGGAFFGGLISDSGGACRPSQMAYLSLKNSLVWFPHFGHSNMR